MCYFSELFKFLPQGHDIFGTLAKLVEVSVLIVQAMYCIDIDRYTIVCVQVEEEVNDKGEEEDDEENELEVIHAGLAGHVMFPLPDVHLFYVTQFQKTTESEFSLVSCCQSKPYTTHSPSPRPFALMQCSPSTICSTR